jgi:hypothetical protein
MRGVQFENTKEGTLGTLSVGGRIILKFMRKKKNVRIWTGFNCLTSGGLLYD